MSSETDHPRQRTVAELLAEHGDAGATGRRRRRREADGQADGGASPEYGAASAPPARQPTPQTAADRGVLREPVPREPRPPESHRREPASRGAPPAARPREDLVGNGWPRDAAVGPQPVGRSRAVPPAPRGDVERPAGRSNGAAANGAASNGSAANGTAPKGAAPNGAASKGPATNGVARNGAANGAASNGAASNGGRPMGFRPAPDPVRERPTDQMPRIRGFRSGQLDPGLTGPIEHQRPGPDLPRRDGDGPATARRAGPAVVEEDDDGGPSTMVGAAPAGAEAWHRSRTAGRSGALADGGPPTEAGDMPLDFDEFDDFDDHPAGLGGEPADSPASGAPAGAVDLRKRPADGEPARQRRLGRSAATTSPGQAWLAVVAQWIVGAVGGAALWVGFRLLWRELPVVALAAAVLVTVGLVLVVRALLRNNDLRTTVFAVAVGLLLTVSPAILVLLGR